MRSRRSRVTNAAVASSAGAGRGRADRVERLLYGEHLDTSRVPYDFDRQNLGLVGIGPDAERAMGVWARSLGHSSLIVQPADGAVWGWVGNRGPFAPEEIDALRPVAAGGDLRLAVGEPAAGLAGWRLTHQQAKAALPVALRSAEKVVRYSEVAMLTTAMRDELLAASLRHLYLEPLGDQRDAGGELRRTLRAFFDADRNVSRAGIAIGVTRQTVARRLGSVEAKLGRPLAACAADLELALRFEELEATPPAVP